MKQLLFTAGIFTLGVVAGAMLVHGQAPDWDPSRMLVPGVRCLDAEQDLGEVWQTDSLELEFHLVNESRKDTFEIGPFHGGCVCTSVTPEKVTMSPGDKVTVKATVDLDRYRFPDSGPMEFTETVLAIAKDPFGEKFALHMTARAVVRPSYRIEPQALWFGTIFRPDTPAVSAEVECLSPEAVERLEIVSAPEGLETTVERLPGKGNAFRLTVRPLPDIAYGPLKGRIRFRTKLASGPFVSRSLGLRAHVVDDLHALPSSLNLGVVTLGDTVARSVTLVSKKGEPFWVQSVEGTGPTLSVQDMGGTQPSRQQYRVSFAPDESRAWQGKLAFRLCTAPGSEHSVLLPWSAFVTTEWAP